MTTNTDAWNARVHEAQEHAFKVYQHEVERLEQQVAATDRHEAHEVRHVEHQVERDADFAAHHLEYLGKVVDREAAKVSRAYAHLAAKHAARVEASAERHIERVVASTAKHLDRDARAAARHVVKGAEKLGLDEERLDDDFQVDAARVEEALQRAVREELSV